MVKLTSTVLDGHGQVETGMEFNPQTVTGSVSSRPILKTALALLDQRAGRGCVASLSNKMQMCCAWSMPLPWRKGGLSSASTERTQH